MSKIFNSEKAVWTVKHNNGVYYFYARARKTGDELFKGRSTFMCPCGKAGRKDVRTFTKLEQILEANYKRFDSAFYLYQNLQNWEETKDAACKFIRGNCGLYR